jgi:hypothetical protein
LPKFRGEDKWEENPFVDELRTAKEWGLTPSQWLHDEPAWSKELMMAYEAVEADTHAAIEYDEEKKRKKRK